MTLCKLCLENKPLVKSHIIPEFMYKPLYDTDHRFNILETHVGRKGRLPKGVYEKLLCKECDTNIIGKYESHASSVIFGDGKKEIEVEKTKYGLLVHGIDYTLFKLFQISIIWRCSISYRKEIHKINLGYHQEIMRQMLLNGYPHEYFRYGVQMYYFPQSSRSMIDLIVSPVLVEKLVDGHETFRAIFNGVCWIFVMSDPTKIFSERKYFLSANGNLPILNSGLKGERYVQELMRDFLGKKCN